MDASTIARKAAAHKAAALANLQDARRAATLHAHELYEAKHVQAQTTKEARQDRELTESHPLDLYPTPATLATHMVYMADIPSHTDIINRRVDGCAILEPSAGTGRIAQAIRDVGHECQCIELNYSAAELLRQRGFLVQCTDFLSWNPSGMYDRIIMNPPFSNGQDIDHVRHAYELLAPGGRLVAIMSEGSFTNSQRKATDFRGWLDNLPYHDEQLPEGTFKQSGTGVNTRLVIIDKA